MREGGPAAWEKRLTQVDVPCAAIRSIDEILNHPQVKHRNLLQTVESSFGPITLIGPGFQFAHDSGGVERAPARTGEHTDEILAEADYGHNDISRWREARAISPLVLP